MSWVVYSLIVVVDRMSPTSGSGAGVGSRVKPETGLKAEVRSVHTIYEVYRW